MIRLLFSDVDRTLLTHGYDLLPAVSRAVAAAGEAGIRIVLATARPPMAVRPYAAALGLTKVCVCLNGAWVGDLDDGVGLTLGALDAVVVQRLLDQAAADGTHTLIYTASGIYTLRITPVVEFHCKRTGEVVVGIEGLHSVRQPVLKVLCISSPGEAPWAFSRLRAVGGPAVDAAQSRVDLLEITSATVSKGSAADLVSRHLKVPSEQWAAIGDGDNDVSLLSRAAVKLTVANATAAVKQIAQHQFSSCDAGGFAEAMDFLIARNAAQDAAVA